MKRGTLSLIGCLVLAAGVLGAFAASAGAATAASKLVFCSDITYPPEEFYVGSKPAGSDIDIGTAIAKRLGKTAQFDNTGFDGIIAALLAKKCDLVISGMNDTPARRKQVGFVDYLKVGQSIMVKAGNPSHISSLGSLAGKSVSVEVGTTNKDFLDAASKKLKTKIKVVAFPKDTDAASALKAGRVDAYFGDSPVVAYYIQKDKSFAFAGAPINPIPVGIAVRKGDALQASVQKAVNAMYADGTMKRILAKWKLSGSALKK
jgi:polar amino acid transport system substrate-binding protein